MLATFNPEIIAKAELDPPALLVITNYKVLFLSILPTRLHRL